MTAYMMSFVWQWLVFRLQAGGRPRLALIPGGIYDKLFAVRRATWVPLRTPRRPLGIEGVVVDSHVTRSPDWVGFLAECTLNRIPVYEAKLVYETMTGRVYLRDDTERHFEGLSLPYPAKAIIGSAFACLLSTYIKEDL